MKLVTACFLVAMLASESQAGCRSTQAGCQGHQAKATGCVGAQAGCTSTQASCYGGHGGLLGRFHPLDRLRNRRHVHSVPSATLEPPLAKPMPKNASAALEVQTVNVAMVYGVHADALDAANAQRAKRGLRAFQRDEGLMEGALACATYRANNRIHGHTRNDFAYLPVGTTAKVGGCSALESSWGFQACDLYANWQYAGAASVQGADSLVYHQLFVK